MQKIIKSVWEGKHLDLWAFVHFLSGVTFGAAALFLKLSFQTSFLILLAAAILWEFFEIYKKIREYRVNQVLDVLAAGAGFGLAFFLLPFLAAERFYLAIIFGLVLILAVLNYLGWKDHKRREAVKHRQKQKELI